MAVSNRPGGSLPASVSAEPWCRSRKALIQVIACCLAAAAALVLACAPAAFAREGDHSFQEIANFDRVGLFHVDQSGVPTSPVEDGELISASDPLAVEYFYHLTEDQIAGIQPDVQYYLSLSNHLVPTLNGSKDLQVQTDDGPFTFAKLFGDGLRVWVVFEPGADGSTTALVERGFFELRDAYLYVDCNRAKEVPGDAAPLPDEENRYLIDLGGGNGDNVIIGYEENEPVSSEASIDKEGAYRDGSIDWRIEYTSWQNPGADDAVTKEAPFEIRDVIDAEMHTLDKGSVTVGGKPVPVLGSREDIPADAALYALLEQRSEGENPVLVIGGTDLGAGSATAAKPAEPIEIAYVTHVKDELLLPGGEGGGKQVSNGAQLFAGADGGFQALDVRDSAAVTIEQPDWVTKSGVTHRVPGEGATMEWTVTIDTCGFALGPDNNLILHDAFPSTSMLDASSVRVDGRPAADLVVQDHETSEGGPCCSFALEGLTADGNKPLTITYRTKVSEETYQTGDDLGSNRAWATFIWPTGEGEGFFETPHVNVGIDAGDGSGGSNILPIVKTNGGYDHKSRSVNWEITINSHRVDLREGIFTDDLGAMGEPCGEAGHKNGMDLAGDLDDVEVLINGSKMDAGYPGTVKVSYRDQVMTVETEGTGSDVITLRFKTVLCDPCVFAGNTSFWYDNVVTGTDLVIGGQPARDVSASSPIYADIEVLKKHEPEYDYAAGTLTWSIDVNQMHLPMGNVQLTDTLQDGLSYVEGSLKTEPALPGATAAANGRELTIDLGDLQQAVAVTFETKVDARKLGFNGTEPVRVENTVGMTGAADGVDFKKVESSSGRTFENHGMVKGGKLDAGSELIDYAVLINPYHLPLSASPRIVDTMDPRLQLDLDSLRLQEVTVKGTAGEGDRVPEYEPVGEPRPLAVDSYDVERNSFVVTLPVEHGETKAYVLTYSADVLKLEAGEYRNSVHFDGGDVVLGGDKNNEVSFAGGGGGGGGGIAARKVRLSIAKADLDSRLPLAGVEFTLYRWDEEASMRGPVAARGVTDDAGELSFFMNPGATYELVETEGLANYDDGLLWENLPEGAAPSGDGLLLRDGSAGTEMVLELANERTKTDISFRVETEDGIPASRQDVHIYDTDPRVDPKLDPLGSVEVGTDGTVVFPDVPRDETYWIELPDGSVIEVVVPAGKDDLPEVVQPDGSTVPMTPDYTVTVDMPEDQRWDATVTVVVKDKDASGAGQAVPVPGVELEIYADKECTVLIGTGVTDGSGKLIVEGLMPGQPYWVKPAGVPDGFLPLEGLRTVTDADPLLELVIERIPVEPEPPADPELPDGTEPKPEAPGGDEGPALPDGGGGAVGGSGPSGLPGTGDPAAWALFALAGAACLTAAKKRR